MASRAHHDYYGFPPDRPRRAVHYSGRSDRSDPFVAPRDDGAGASAVLIASAVAATAIIVGGAYAVYAGVPPPPMGETHALPLVSDYRVDDEPVKARLAELLLGPAQAVPSLGTTSESTEETDTPENATPAPQVRTPRAEVRVEPAPVPRARPIPAPAPTAPLPSDPGTPKEVPYPDPITTPPDAIAPPDTNPELPQPLLDPENPYR
jgi:hypothetical protein